MTELSVTWARAGRVFLAFLWRALLMASVIALVLGLAAFFVLAGSSAWIETAVATILALAAYAIAGVWAMRRALKGDFGDFRVMLTEPRDKERLRELEAARESASSTTES